MDLEAIFHKTVMGQVPEVKSLVEEAVAAGMAP